MRKPLEEYDLEIPVDDLKMEIMMGRDKANFESQKIWLYVGADNSNPGFAKIGMTMGDLRSRSYSSANPNYYLFCAFQCDQSTTKEQLVSIEQSALVYLDSIFKWESGLTKRRPHTQSQILSECYYNINFEEFFVTLHDYLIENHVRYFQTSEYENEAGHDDGYALWCFFNPHLAPNVIKYFERRIRRF